MAAKKKRSHEEPPQEISGNVFCITGTLSRPRAEMEHEIRAAGGDVAKSVTKEVTILVASQPGTKKCLDAAKKGVMVVDEAWLHERLGTAPPKHEEEQLTCDYGYGNCDNCFYASELPNKNGGKIACDRCGNYKSLCPECAGYACSNCGKSLCIGEGEGDCDCVAQHGSFCDFCEKFTCRECAVEGEEEFSSFCSKKCRKENAAYNKEEQADKKRAEMQEKKRLREVASREEFEAKARKRRKNFRDSALGQAMPLRSEEDLLEFRVSTLGDTLPFRSQQKKFLRSAEVVEKMSAFYR